MSRLRPVSSKKLAALGGRVPSSTLKASGGERFPGLVVEAYREWVRGLPCVLAGREGHRCWHPERRCDAAHVATKARGAGDVANLWPACRSAHDEQHRYGIKSFQVRWGLNLREIAGALWLRYEAEQGAPKL